MKGRRLSNIKMATEPRAKGGVLAGNVFPLLRGLGRAIIKKNNLHIQFNRTQVVCPDA
jgi:hypothetical protein